MSNAKELIITGNKAKDGELKEIADLAIARLLDMIYRDHNADVRIVLETQDPTGQSSDESHYDLLLVELVEVENENIDLDIPAPLLKQLVSLSCYKRAIAEGRVHDRKEHNRESHEATEDEANILWYELTQYASYPDYRDAAIQFLNWKGKKLNRVLEELATHYPDPVVI